MHYHSKSDKKNTSCNGSGKDIHIWGFQKQSSGFPRAGGFCLLNNTWIRVYLKTLVTYSNMSNGTPVTLKDNWRDEP